MKIRNFRIKTQLLVSVISMITFVIILGIVSIVQSEYLHQQTKTFYNHPFQVRTAVHALKTDVALLRVGTRDMMLADTEKEINDTKKLIEECLIDAEKRFEVIKEKYLGSPSDVDKAYEAFRLWNSARNENIQNILRDKKKVEEVKQRIKAEGINGILRDDMLQKIEVINAYATEKSMSIYQNSESLKHILNLELIALVVFILIFTMIINYIVLRNIRIPINELTDVARRLQNGELHVRSKIYSKNEFSILSESFNGLAEKVQQNMVLNNMENTISATMLKEENPHYFFQSLLPALSTLTNSQIAAVYLLNDDKSEFVHFESIGLSNVEMLTFSATSYEGEFGKALLTKSIQKMSEIPHDTHFILNTVSGKIIPREIITIPIIVSDEIVAVLSLAAVRKYNDTVNTFIENIYDTLNARIEGVLAYLKLKKFSQELEIQKETLAQVSNYNRALIEASIDPLVTIGIDGKITDVNKSTELVTGYNRAELIGTDFAEYFTNKEKAAEVHQIVFEQGNVRDFELEINHKKGHKTPVLYNATVFTDTLGNNIGIFAAARDITETKKNEEKLIHLNEILNHRSQKLSSANVELEAQKNELSSQSDELIRQNFELENQKNKLNELNRLKTSFLSNMSHELRTPLNSVIALSGVLNRRLANKIAAEEYSYLGVIERNGKHLLSLINDILDISRIEAGREEIEISEINVNNVIADIVEMIQPQVDEKQIELLHNNANTAIRLNSDSKKLRQILQNLVANAVKFTEKGQVSIQTIETNTNIKIVVADTGIGISNENIEHIFDEFRQADGSTSRRFGGTGLGLSIARKYARLLGGDITVSSEINKGSIFTLTLNKGKDITNNERLNDTDIKKQSPETKQRIKGKTILLVDDSEPARIQMSEFLKENGINILTASGGDEALSIIEKTIPDGIILDLMMPGTDGFKVLETIRNAERTANIPVLIVSAKHINKEELSFLKQNNIKQLVQKGDINKAEFLNAVSTMVVNSEIDKKESKHQTKTLNNPPSILIVEDNEDNILTLKAILNNRFTIFEASNGFDGLTLSKTHKPDLILMDIALPGMNGIDVFKSIRNNPDTAKIPVIALTASTMLYDKETILSHGFDAYIAKPIDEKVFEKTINEVLYGK